MKKDNPGLPRVYWKSGAWRYKCNDCQKALVGKSWIRLGVSAAEAREEMKRWEGCLFPRAGMGRIFDRYEGEIISCQAVGSHSPIKPDGAKTATIGIC